jgi:hypothetical protein
VATALYWAGVTAWGVHARLMSGIELWFWPLLALAVPHLWRIAGGTGILPVAGSGAARQFMGKMPMPLAWLVWVLAICVSVGTGCSMTDHLAEYWILVYASLFTVMWLAGRQWFDDESGVRRQPLQSIGATVVALWPVAAMCLWGAAVRRKDIAGAVAGLMPVLAALGFVFGDSAERDFAMPLVFDVFLLAVGVATVVAGVRERRLSVTNGGMLVLSALIICRFFDSDLDFVVKGLAFIAVGVGFLATNLVVVRRKGPHPDPLPQTTRERGAHADGFGGAQ